MQNSKGYAKSLEFSPALGLIGRAKRDPPPPPPPNHLGLDFHIIGERAKRAGRYLVMSMESRDI